VDASWREVSGKKKNRNSSEMSMPRKQPKMNRYEPSKLMSTINSFERLEEELNDVSTNVRLGKITKVPPIFQIRDDNFLSFSQLLKKIAASKYEIKIINEQIKIQPNNSIAYLNIVKELRNKNMEFHRCKPKKERSFRVVLFSIKT
jgi:hypothetical protein